MGYKKSTLLRGAKWKLQQETGEFAGVGRRIDAERYGWRLCGALTAVLLVSSWLAICCPALAQDGTVPEPRVRENHRYDYQEGDGQRNITESWGVEITRDNFIIIVGAADFTDRGERQVSYSQNINFYVGNKFYIAMFCIDHIDFLVGNQTLPVPLSRCGGFTVSYTEIEYVGEEPTLDCDIYFSDVRLYNDTSDSTFDLTISHHITCGWNETRVKVGVDFSFNGTVLYDGATELSEGAPFSVEICYVMQLTDNELENPDFPGDNTVAPQSMTNDSLLYNLTTGGTQYELSRLVMNNSFLDLKADPPGTHVDDGYSGMAMAGPQTGPGSYNPKAAIVIHGFPGLSYNYTDGISSDPELTIFHDAQKNDGQLELWIPATAVVVIASIAALVILLRHRRHHA